MKPIIFAVCLMVPVASSANAQSNVSQVSSLSLAPAVELSSIGLQSLKAGGKFTVASVRRMGEIVEVVVSSGVEASVFTIRLAAGAAATATVVAGMTISAVAVSAGWILYLGGEAIACVLDETMRAHVHHRVL